MKKKILVMTALAFMLGTQVYHASNSVYMTIKSSRNFNNEYITEPVQIKAESTRLDPGTDGDITAYIRIDDDGTYEIVRFGK